MLRHSASLSPLHVRPETTLSANGSRWKAWREATELGMSCPFTAGSSDTGVTLELIVQQVNALPRIRLWLLKRPVPQNRTVLAFHPQSSQCILFTISLIVSQDGLRSVCREGSLSPRPRRRTFARGWPRKQGPRGHKTRAQWASTCPACRPCQPSCRALRTTLPTRSHPARATLTRRARPIRARPTASTALLCIASACLARETS